MADKELTEFLEDEPYYPDLEDEDYTSVSPSITKGLRNVDVTAEVFKNKVDQAFRKRMEKVLSPNAISEAINSQVYNRCVLNKFKEVQKDNNNLNLSQEKVLRGHIASLMHCLFLVFS